MLVPVVQRICKTLRDAGESAGDVAKVLGRCIHGVDIDPAAVLACKKRLSAVAATFGVAGVRWQIQCGDASSRQYWGKKLGEYDVVVGNMDEREHLGKDCAKADCIILRNHGLLTVGKTIRETFKRMYFLETACQIQTAAGYGPLIEVGEPSCSAAIQRYEEKWASGTYADLEWESMLRMLERSGSDYRQ